MKTEIWATRQPYFGDGIELRIVDRENKTACFGVELKPVEKGGLIPAAVHLSDDMAQQLMNSLWECGIRPAGSVGSVGQLAATEKHLEDMRALAFSKLNVAKP